eukprot:4608638-Amphidinium_carterae.1
MTQLPKLVAPQAMSRQMIGLFTKLWEVVVIETPPGDKKECVMSSHHETHSWSQGPKISLGKFNAQLVCGGWRASLGISLGTYPMQTDKATRALS